MVTGSQGFITSLLSALLVIMILNKVTSTSNLNNQATYA